MNFSLLALLLFVSSACYLYLSTYSDSVVLGDHLKNRKAFVFLTDLDNSHNTLDFGSETRTPFGLNRFDWHVKSLFLALGYNIDVVDIDAFSTASEWKEFLDDFEFVILGSLYAYNQYSALNSGIEQMVSEGSNAIFFQRLARTEVPFESYTILTTQYSTNPDSGNELNNNKYAGMGYKHPEWTLFAGSPEGPNSVVIDFGSTKFFERMEAEMSAESLYGSGFWPPKKATIEISHDNEAYTLMRTVNPYAGEAYIPFYGYLCVDLNVATRYVRLNFTGNAISEIDFFNFTCFTPPPFFDMSISDFALDSTEPAPAYIKVFNTTIFPSFTNNPLIGKSSYRKPLWTKRPYYGLNGGETALLTTTDSTPVWSVLQNENRVCPFLILKEKGQGKMVYVNHGGLSFLEGADTVPILFWDLINYMADDTVLVGKWWWKNGARAAAKLAQHPDTWVSGTNHTETVRIVARDAYSYGVYLTITGFGPIDGNPEMCQFIHANYDTTFGPTHNLYGARGGSYATVLKALEGDEQHAAKFGVPLDLVWEPHIYASQDSEIMRHVFNDKNYFLVAANEGHVPLAPPYYLTLDSGDSQIIGIGVYGAGINYYRAVDQARYKRDYYLYGLISNYYHPPDLSTPIRRVNANKTYEYWKGQRDGSPINPALVWYTNLRDIGLYSKFRLENLTTAYTVTNDVTEITLTSTSSMKNASLFVNIGNFDARNFFGVEIDGVISNNFRRDGNKLWMWFDIDGRKTIKVLHPPVKITNGTFLAYTFARGKSFTLTANAPSGANVTFDVYISPTEFPHEEWCVTCAEASWGKTWDSATHILKVWVISDGTVSITVEKTFDVTVRAHCNTEGIDIGVSIVMDGSPTDHITPHTFTGLAGTHTFTVPNTDPNGHAFKQWNTGHTTTTITIATSGTYTAYYQEEYLPPVPEFPLGGAFEMALMLGIISVWLNRRRKILRAPVP